ncbi:unnamed protein product [Cylindrotheca closterium]|uniref:33 kDa chaperonin n=1 Tax=Cylindrotheca closterium TaxID=2856 RepID=A0AAD2CG96_9STRA|nr:unnamed protein product [Cylindrotheca closterium]
MVQLVIARSIAFHALEPTISPRSWMRRHGRILRSLSTSNDDDSTQTDGDRLADFRNKNNIRDQVFSAMSADGSIKVTACTARNLVNDLMIMHTMTATPSDALGRAITCALLMSNGMQEEQVIQLTVNTDGPIRGVVATSTGKAEVRGYVGTPGLGDIELKEAVGLGTLQVVKNHPDWPRPYTGISAVRHGDIDRDVGAYLAESEQRSCALAAATSINGILCTAAGGYLIEQLPNADRDTLSQVEKNLATLVQKDGGDKLPTNLLLNGFTPVDIAETILDGLEMQPLQQMEPKFHCPCSSDRLLRALRLLSPEEVEDILETEGKIEARCEFCGKVYRMSPEEVRVEMASATGDPSKDTDFEDN